MTSDEHDILRQHGESLASISTNIEFLRKDLNGKIPKLEAIAAEHAKQINYWRGAISLLAFLFLIAGAVGAWHIFEHSSAPTSNARP